MFLLVLFLNNDIVDARNIPHMELLVKVIEQ